MNQSEFSTLKIGDIVFAVINTGITGISKYQYSSITKDHAGKMMHVFLSPYLLSTILIEVGNESKSRQLKSLHFTEDAAKEYKAECRMAELNEYES